MKDIDLLYENQIVLPLSSINWDFPNSNKIKGIHSIHPYPAKFIPEIPGSIIDILNPSKEGAILDPFCGSGVTLLEAQKRGYDSIGIDLNPIACLISRVKTAHFDLEKLQKTANEVLLQAKSQQVYTIPSIPNLDHWFKRDVQIGLTKLIDSIQRLANSLIKDALLLSCSSIIVRVSNQDSDTRYAAVEKTVSEQTVYDSFAKAVKQLIIAKSKENPLLSINAEVINDNI